MPLKMKLSADEFGELDEANKGLYKELEDGNLVLDVDGVDDHPNVQSLKSGHQRSKQEREEARRQAEAFKQKLGPLADYEDVDLSNVDPERFTQLQPYLTGEKELPKEGEAKDQVDYDKIKANARKPLERDLETVTQERDQLKQRFEGVVIDNALSNAVSEVKIHGPYVKAVKAMFKDKVKVSTDEDGNTVALVEGEYGEQPVEKYLKDWAQTDEGKAFVEADRNSGGGSRGGSGDGKIKNPWSKENWNMTEQARVFKEDPERAKRMAAEHGKSVGAR